MEDQISFDLLSTISVSLSDSPLYSHMLCNFYKQSVLFLNILLKISVIVAAITIQGSNNKAIIRIISYQGKSYSTGDVMELSQPILYQ